MSESTEPESTEKPKENNEESVENSGGSGIIKQKDELHLQGQLAYVLPSGEKNFIPDKTLILSRKVIAGAGSDKKLRVEQRLANRYSSSKIGEWQKCVGKVESEKYIFDIHWYEKDGVQYEMKLKNRSDKK